MKKGRVSVPGKIINMLLSDDQFYREVSSSKKISLQNFPKYDQWTDEEGFNMEFALAGFSSDDISIDILGNMLTISSNRADHASTHDYTPDVVSESAEHEGEPPRARINRGMIVRGIARRNFVTDFLISPEFDLDLISASMCNGLLKIVVPKSNLLEPKRININD